MKKVHSLISKVFAIVVLIGITMNIPGITLVTVNADGGIPKYSDKASIVLNGNSPSFDADELTTVSFESYGRLDRLGRCTTAETCIGKDLMPTEARGSIGSVKTSGWNQNKYPGLVDSEPPYLYNRCHMIGYQLTGENANEKNLITGTRYMNVEGMLPYENMVASYVHRTGNHVMYRVTPIFSGSNLLCDGVQMEALSVEDNGKGVRFNIFCYNVQPGVIINYADGSNYADENYVFSPETQDFKVSSDSADQNIESGEPSSDSNGEQIATYIANKNTKKFHYPYCGSVSSMSEKNKWYYEGSRDELISKGYQSCKKCNP
ncbi:DNA/RNA non-specific endonuclease [Butyrivibrio sp. AE2005]|uniref:DNA/RNA non-specific endonuclease n=1 Tax=Butyrivibrio sp. AE2005 TaxID=1496722 RepID=UPI00047AC917|nr:DNA/RNA non-specific endonuclease [Butyrivibrio sp. AE2005]